MACVEITNQAEFDAAVGRGDCAHVRSGEWVASGNAQVRASGNAQVTASDSARVTAYGSAQVRAYNSTQVTAYGSTQVRATSYVAVTVHGDMVKVDGGVLIRVPVLTTTAAWCEYHGVEVKDGVVTVYKAVGANFMSPRGGAYAPGSVPVAEDWDGGKAECGGGLHFSPHAFMALEFNTDAKRFVACPVALADMRVPQPTDSMPQKIKAKGCCAPVYEVDIDGNPVGGESNG